MRTDSFLYDTALGFSMPITCALGGFVVMMTPSEQKDNRAIGARLIAVATSGRGATTMPHSQALAATVTPSNRHVHIHRAFGHPGPERLHQPNGAKIDKVQNQSTL
jgi:hypothetical protein